MRGQKWSWIKRRSHRFLQWKIFWTLFERFIVIVVVVIFGALVYNIAFNYGQGKIIMMIVIEIMRSKERNITSEMSNKMWNKSREIFVAKFFYKDYCYFYYWSFVFGCFIFCLWLFFICFLYFNFLAFSSSVIYTFFSIITIIIGIGWINVADFREIENSARLYFAVPFSALPQMAPANISRRRAGVARTSDFSAQSNALSSEMLYVSRKDRIIRPEKRPPPRLRIRGANSQLLRDTYHAVIRCLWIFCHAVAITYVISSLLYFILI